MSSPKTLLKRWGKIDMRWEVNDVRHWSAWNPDFSRIWITMVIIEYLIIILLWFTFHLMWDYLMDIFVYLTWIFVFLIIYDMNYELNSHVCIKFLCILWPMLPLEACPKSRGWGQLLNSYLPCKRKKKERDEKTRNPMKTREKMSRNSTIFLFLLSLLFFPISWAGSSLCSTKGNFLSSLSSFLNHLFPCFHFISISRIILWVLVEILELLIYSNDLGPNR